MKGNRNEVRRIEHANMSSKLKFIPILPHIQRIKYKSKQILRYSKLSHWELFNQPLFVFVLCVRFINIDNGELEADYLKTLQ